MADAPSAAVRAAEVERWNRTRYDPLAVDPARGHVESTFIKLNDPESARALWLKATIFAPTTRTSGGPPHERGRTVGEAWAIAFDHAAETEPSGYRNTDPSAAAPTPRHVAVKQTTPIEDAHLAPLRGAGAYLLDVAGLRFDGRRVSGCVAHGSARVTFDLALTPRDSSPYTPLPHPALYRDSSPQMKPVSPIFDAVADGEVEIESSHGRRHWRVRRWPAMQGHNWGRRHAHTYAWAHCNVWHEPEGRELVFEGFTARVALCTLGKGRTLASPPVTIVAVRHRGVRFEARALADVLRGQGDVDELRRWTFQTRQGGASISGSFSLRDDDIVGLYYPNPDGAMTYCLNSKLARATLRFAIDGRTPLVLTSDAAALEIGTADAAHGARMYV